MFYLFRWYSSPPKKTNSEQCFQNAISLDHSISTSRISFSPKSCIKFMHHPIHQPPCSCSAASARTLRWSAWTPPGRRSPGSSPKVPSLPGSSRCPKVKPLASAARQKKRHKHMCFLFDNGWEWWKWYISYIYCVCILHDILLNW